MVTKMSPPWIVYYRKVNALFDKDPEIRIAFDEDEMELRIYVDSNVKAQALACLLPTMKEFGVVVLKITVVPCNSTTKKSSTLKTDRDLLIATFEGNPAVKEFKSVQFGPEEVLYVIFQKEVVQFFTDDLTDIYGLCSTLYQDIAKDVFENVGGVFFCTSNNAVSSLFMPNYSLTSSCISLS